MKNTINQLHILRAIACVGVVLTHAKFALWSGGVAYIALYPTHDWGIGKYVLFGMDLISSLGSQRVYLFFILSGFFLQYSARQQFSIGDYLRKRIWRIYPPLVVATLLSGVAIYLTINYINPDLRILDGREYNTRLLAAYHDLTLRSLFSTLTFIVKGEYFAFNHQFWSLQHELLFYLIFPAYNLCSRKVRLGLIGVCLAVSYVTHSNMVFCQVFFLTGTLFCDVFTQGYQLPWQTPKWAYYLFFSALYVVIYLLSKYGYMYAPSVLTILLAFVAFEFLLRYKLQIPALLTWLSNISYSVYLNHMWVLMLCYALLTRVSGQIVFYNRWPYYIGAVIAILLSSGLYYMVEKPVIAYIRRPKVPRAATYISKLA